MSAGLERFGSAVFASAAQSLAALRQPQRFALVFGWALAHWLVNSLAFWIGFSAVGIEVSFLAAMFTQGVVAMASSLPQAPAFAGGFQVAGLLALSAFGVPQESATAWGIGYWLFSFVPITALGLYYTLRTQLTMRELKEMVTRAGDEHATRTTPT